MGPSGVGSGVHVARRQADNISPFEYIALASCAVAGGDDAAVRATTY